MRTSLITSLILLSLALTACLGVDSSQAEPPRMATVDLGKIMSTSRAAEAGRAHLQEVRKNLEKGYADLEKAWAKAPAKEKEATLHEGMLALRRQLAVEEAAVQNIVNALLLDEVKKWRADNKAALVLARQNALDADPALDITASLITAMNSRDVSFPPLPVVTVNKPQAAKPEENPAARQTPPADARNNRNNDQKKR